MAGEGSVSAVDLSPMGNNLDIHGASLIVNEIGHAVIADANSPQAAGPGEFHGPLQTGITCQRQRFFNHAGLYRLGQLIQRLVGAGIEADGVAYVHSPNRLRTADRDTEGSCSRRLASAMSPLS